MDGTQISQFPLISHKRQRLDEPDEFHAPIPSIEPFTSRIAQPTTPQSLNSPKSMAAPILPNGASRQPSPALSTISTLTSVDATPPPPGLDDSSQCGTGEPQVKRRKLTFAEKEVRRAEKAEKERVKAEQKTRREEEKREKYEELRQKNELKEDRKRQRELEKQQKEEEKRQKEQEKEDDRRRKEEEKLKKEKAQPRILSFFAKPQQPMTPLPARSLQASVTTAETPTPGIALPNPLFPTTDYDRLFLPFSLPSNTSCAPIHRFTWDEDALSHLESTFDRVTKISVSELSAPKLRDSLSTSPWDSASRGLRHSAKDIMSRLADNATSSIDSIETFSTSELVQMLRDIPTKFIFFHEDYRPPYIGSYTKGVNTQSGARLARNSFRKLRTDTDYDVDSEAEWEAPEEGIDPEEGEDIGSERESDAESVDTTEDLDGFLDDEEIVDGQVKRRLLAGDMDPVCSGLCWADETGQVLNPTLLNLNSLKLEVIEWAHKLPIDPFSTAYWVDQQTNIPQVPGINEVSHPGWLPLQSQQNVTLTGLVGTPFGKADIINTLGSGKPTKVPPRLLAGEDLEEFKRAVEGSPHNKQGLLAILKKERFPKVSAAVLKDTLGAVGVRVGRSEAEKKWVIINAA